AAGLLSVWTAVNCRLRPRLRVLCSRYSRAAHDWPPARAASVLRARRAVCHASGWARGATGRRMTGDGLAAAGEVDRIRRVFTDHPQQQARIVARLRREGVDLEHLRESDLADDPRSGITDQNHIGGRALAVALGARAGLRQGMRVLDLCSGL